jgi:hypothetical protein
MGDEVRAVKVGSERRAAPLVYSQGRNPPLFRAAAGYAFG